MSTNVILDELWVALSLRLLNWFGLRHDVLLIIGFLSYPTIS